LVDSTDSTQLKAEVQPMRTFSRICTLVGMSLLLLLATSATQAEDQEALKRKVDRLAQPVIDHQALVGFVVGVIDNGQSYVFGYGKLSQDQSQSPDGNTVFEIGSITKVFTGLLLADMVEKKEVELEAPLQQFLPDSVKIPEHDGQAITLLDLATHTSGLPRMPSNFSLAMARNPANPHSAYTQEDLYAFLSSYTLAQKPGTQFDYSNLGMGLLGIALARHAHADYGDLVVQRICTPLRMNDTRIKLSESQQRRMAPGHDADGKPVANWDVALAGAGALRSTVNDMLIFLSANLGLQDSPLAAAIELSHRPRRPIDQSGARIGLAWHIGSKGEIWWHNGQTGGYHSYAALRKSRKIAVVVLANSAHPMVDELGFRLMGTLAGEPVPPIKFEGRKAGRPAKAGANR
jgi:serine-type D-Ala-D-Ala carboxypeptidase/endopeptidase